MTDPIEKFGESLASSTTGHSKEEPPFQVSLLRKDRVLLLTLRGELDVHYYESLHGPLSEALSDPECAELVADMSELVCIDSSGLSIFINAMQSLRGRGGTVHLVGCLPMVRRVLGVTRLDRIFPNV